MANLQEQLTDYIGSLLFPVTKEEMINGLLVSHAPRDDISLIERLPRDTYESQSEVLSDLAEISQVHADELAQAKTYEDYLRLVIRHAGDISHTTKEEYNRVVSSLVQSAQRQGYLPYDASRDMEQRLMGAFAGLRGSMSEVTDDSASLDPSEDLPRTRT